jgi:hypothetical protein
VFSTDLNDDDKKKLVADAVFYILAQEQKRPSFKKADIMKAIGLTGRSKDLQVEGASYPHWHKVQRGSKFCFVVVVHYSKYCNIAQCADAPQGVDTPQCADAPQGVDTPQCADAPQGVDTPPGADAPQGADALQAAKFPQGADAP